MTVLRYYHLQGQGLNANILLHAIGQSAAFLHSMRHMAQDIKLPLRTSVPSVDHFRKSVHSLDFVRNIRFFRHYRSYYQLDQNMNKQSNNSNKLQLQRYRKQKKLRIPRDYSPFNPCPLGNFLSWSVLTWQSSLQQFLCIFGITAHEEKIAKKAVFFWIAEFQNTSIWYIRYIAAGYRKSFGWHLWG